MMIMQLVGSVAVWWMANAVTSITSKSAMTPGKDATSWLPALTDLRWLELTALQHFMGAVATVVLLKGVLRTSFHPSGASKKAMAMATLGNVVGNLATNAAYVLISSSSTQVVKACEPLFTLVLSTLLYKKHTAFQGYTQLVSIPIMIAGACTFVLRDSSFNLWGLTAAVISNLAFPIRNIFLKRLFTNSSWQSSLQNYAVISLYSLLVLSPLLLVKLAVTPLVLRLDEGMVSAVFHSTYNIASVAVLQSVSPITHAILNLSKRVFVIVANIVYFHTPMSGGMAIGLLVFFVGLALYQTAHTTAKKGSIWKLKPFLFALFTCVGLLIAAECYNSFRSHSQEYTLLTRSNSDARSDSMQNGVTKSSSLQKISTAWVFDGPIPTEIVANIQSISAQNPSSLVHIHCGTTHCVNAVSGLNNTQIKAEFLVVPDIVLGSPLEHWLARHPINKVLAGVQFEEHLQEAVRLGILWRDGGIFIDPTVRVVDGLAFPPCKDPWTSVQQQTTKHHPPRLLDVSCFPKQHPFIGDLAEQFVNDYQKVGRNDFRFDFQNLVWNIYTNSGIQKPVSWALEQELVLSTRKKNHYGTLSYDTRAQNTRGSNLGDDMQGFPGLQFLPFIDSFVERDNLSLSAGDQNITTFFNAWWGDKHSSWPPPATIDPIMLSVHVDVHMRDLWAQSKEYLEGKAPIGCRDHSTLDFFKTLSIEAYFSGCLTLLLKNPNIYSNSSGRNDDIYLVDVKSEFVDLLPIEIQEKAVNLTHRMQGIRRYNNLARFTAAYELMEKYASAKLVITQRIHCALPCVAMGTPVIFINSPKMPGGGGSKKASSTRTAGLTPLFHTLDLYTVTIADARQWLQNFTWDSPPTNPDVGMAMRLKATAWNVIRRNQALYDAARKFGLVPLTPPAPATKEQLVFHLIFNTSNSISWLQWRTIESIFFHHHSAKVIVHSNTVPQSVFEVLTEAGYTIEVRSYSLEELLRITPAENFTRKVHGFEVGKYWSAHQSILLRLLVLYKWGGVYIDSDIILVRPVTSLLTTNFMVWEDSLNKSASNAFMMFEMGNGFLKSCLREFTEHYDGSKWAYSGSRLMTRIWSHSFKESNDVHVLDSRTVIVFETKKVARCFNDASETTLASFVKEKAYAVRLNPRITALKGNGKKLKEGTICKHLLNSFCILCDKQH